MNRIILMGRLASDPEVKVTPTDKTVCTFTLAVNRPFAKDEADFIRVVLWGKPAELVGNSSLKGHRLLIEGRLQIRNYIGKDEVKHYVTEVIADRMEFIERRSVDTPAQPTTPMENFGTATSQAQYEQEQIPF